MTILLWAKWTGDVVQAVECLLCKYEAKFKPHSHKKEKRKTHRRVTSLAMVKQV
jgi:Zn ribbon nucleic-acid-binding protein